MTDSWWSIDELNTEAPDEKDYGTTLDNLESLFGVSELLSCFHKEFVPIAKIDQGQLHDDPADAEGIAKIESIRCAMRAGTPLPAVIVVHDKSAATAAPYELIEGRHRYNAAHREGTPLLYAWVAHPGCCGGPAPDL